MRLLRAAVAAAAGSAAYALLEPRLYRLQRHDLPLGPTGGLSVLHLSDAHLTARAGATVDFLRSLPSKLGSAPDLILMTGDMIDDDGGIDPLIEALTPLQAGLGRFYVLGSHDYYQSKFKSPTRYFKKDVSVTLTKPADVTRLESQLQKLGWQPLANATTFLHTEAGTIRIAGIDDPYLKRHRIDHLERKSDEVLAIGMMHAPDVVSEWLLNGFDLVVAGHTHAGQVRLPFVGALVTNSRLPAALAGGPHRIGNGYLHVSPGLGHSKFTPIRFLTRPEATLLRLSGASRSKEAHRRRGAMHP